MEERNETLIKQGLAHVDYATKRCQSMKEHADNVAFFSKNICEIPQLRGIVNLIGILHDAGKLGMKNQEDFLNILEKGDQVHKHGLDHSTAGGRMIREFTNKRSPVESISTAIYCHHGLSDCINLDSGVSLQEQRQNKEIDYEVIRDKFFRIYDKDLLEKYVGEALESQNFINEKLKSFMKKCQDLGKDYGDIEFFRGMYERLLLSLLIDADWTDTACFFQGLPLDKRISLEETQKIWDKCISNFEQFLENEVKNNPNNGNVLNVFRQEISDLCRQAAETDENLYRLTVPTGAGKTLSSLRFALYHAKKKKKKRIIYIAPFNSILEQNAQEIRSAVGDSSIVLEHHCNVVCEQGEEEKYRSLTETWDKPIVASTAVQILNMFFSNQKSCIRRMHTLCNSIIIFDEVQAIPTHCIELFHLAVNFLSQFCNTTVVLCSATQPSLASLKENNIYKCKEMAGDYEKYMGAFKRTEIIDMTDSYPGGMEVEDLTEFTLEKAKEYGSTLVIVNTIACAVKVFQDLQVACEKYEEEYEFFHLSNNMCPQHKLDNLERIRAELKEKKKKVICIATQVVEAGVNFSFGCVIRSKAGLDNVIQAAGRCNRHKELDKMGAVYIVEISSEIEKVSSLQGVKTSQEVLQILLQRLRKNEKFLKTELDSEEVIKAYYQGYYRKVEGKNKNELKFPFSYKSIELTLVDLLGKNEIAKQQYFRTHNNKETKITLSQAFLTAGRAFEVISNDYKVSVIVPYNEEAKALISKLSDPYLKIQEGKQIFRKLQRYTVGISELRKEKLNNAIVQMNYGDVLVLSDGYYDKQVGVVDEPKMEFLGM